MDIKDESLISTIFNDKNLNKDERYMILALKYYDVKGDNVIKVTLKELVNIFGISKITKVQSILKSLEYKGYISMEKIIGKPTNYTFIKESLIFTKSEEENEEEIEATNEEVCLKSNDQIALSTKKVCPKGNDQIVPSTKKVYPLGNRSIENSVSKAPSKTIKNNNAHECESIDKSRGSAHSGGVAIDYNTSVSTKDNNINNYIYNNINNKLYINIFNAWNKININSEPRINPKITDAINIAARSYSEEQIIQAIENYSKVYHSEHYYNHPWKLTNFLTRPNGINRFMDDGDIWISHKNKYEEDDFYGIDFDIEKYID